MPGVSKQEIGCKCQTFFISPLSGRRKQTISVRFFSFSAATAAAKSLQLCPTLCDPIDGSPPGSAVPGILQARTLEWVAISFSNAWKGKVNVKSLSRIRLFATPWSAAYKAPPSVGFSRQECWSGVPLPSPRLLAKNSSLVEKRQELLQQRNRPKIYLKIQILIPSIKNTNTERLKR